MNNWTLSTILSLKKEKSTFKNRSTHFSFVGYYDPVKNNQHIKIHS